jgi:hypothetical protein
MLVLAPAACCLAGIGTDALLSLCLASLKAPDSEQYDDSYPSAMERASKKRLPKSSKPNKVRVDATNNIVHQAPIISSSLFPCTEHAHAHIQIFE